jgi:hypothetical protein
MTKKYFYLTFVVFYFIFFDFSCSFAVDYYAGNIFLQSASKTDSICIISRFKTSDGSFTIQQADKIHESFMKDIIAPEIGYYIDMTVSGSKKPSDAYSSGITGEALWDTFSASGTSVCTISGKPVNQVIFFSFYNCDYQGAMHVCMRTYFHSGTENLSQMGIPYGKVAGLGAIAYAKAFWDPFIEYLYNWVK